jgi:hypothetical protein
MMIVAVSGSVSDEAGPLGIWMWLMCQSAPGHTVKVVWSPLAIERVVEIGGELPVTGPARPVNG